MGETLSTSQLVSTFFGLTSKNALTYRKSLFDQIHQIVFFGNGGYDWGTVYNFPIWLRNYTFSEIKKHYESQKENLENSKHGGNKQSVIDPSGKVKAPNFKQKSSYK